MASKGNDGVDEPAFSGGVRVTTPERTMIDSIKDMDKIAGMEEVIEDISCMEKVQERRVLSYLEHISNQFYTKKRDFCFLNRESSLGYRIIFLKNVRVKLVRASGICHGIFPVECMIISGNLWSHVI